MKIRTFYLCFAYLKGGGVQAHLLLEQHSDVVFTGGSILWQQDSKLLDKLLQGKVNKGNTDEK